MITVFCVRGVGDPPPPEGLTGPGGGVVRVVDQGPLAVWVSDATAPADVDAIRAHDAVVRAALRSATPLPARFGTAFANEWELRASLREREGELLAALARVAGKVEMGLRVEWEEGGGQASSAEPVRSGRDYLEARRREVNARAALRERAERLLDEVESRVVQQGTVTVRTLLPEPGVAGVMAHLVHRHVVGVYRSRVEDARSAFPRVNLRLTGPWAPYSFA